MTLRIHTTMSKTKTIAAAAVLAQRSNANYGAHQGSLLRLNTMLTLLMYGDLNADEMACQSKPSSSAPGLLLVPSDAFTAIIFPIPVHRGQMKTGKTGHTDNAGSRDIVNSTPASLSTSSVVSSISGDLAPPHGTIIFRPSACNNATMRTSLEVDQQHHSQLDTMR